MKTGGIMRREDRDGLVRLPRAAQPSGVRVGDKVKVVGGLFAGNDGLVVGLSNCERVRVLLRVLGRVSMPKGDVVALPP